MFIFWPWCKHIVESWRRFKTSESYGIKFKMQSRFIHSWMGLLMLLPQGIMGCHIYPTAPTTAAASVLLGHFTQFWTFLGKKDFLNTTRGRCCTCCCPHNGWAWGRRRRGLCRAQQTHPGWAARPPGCRLYCRPSAAPLQPRPRYAAHQQLVYGSQRMIRNVLG